MRARPHGLLSFLSAIALTLFGCNGSLLGQSDQSEQTKPPQVSQRSGQVDPNADPLFGLSPFPYDFTPAAVNKVFELGRDHGEIYVVQRDNGIPWAEALNNQPFPSSMMSEWEDFKRRRPQGRPFYLAIAPLDFDRQNLAEAVKDSSIPREIRGAAFDSDAVKRAYANYCRRAVEFFQPDYLNIGVEAGELVHRKPSAWPAFSRLIEHVYADLRKNFPDLKVGISFGLQSLMEPEAAEKASALIEASDYVGISFYPYMSEFHEKFGCSALPQPPEEWRDPLNWLRAYTSKPIAICETGYNSEKINMPEYGISLNGSRELQKQYVEELAGFARRDDYMFVVYYFAVDLDRFFANLPGGGAEARLWESNGLFTKDLEAKPAWDIWKRVVRNDAGLEAPVPAPGGSPDSSDGGEGFAPVAIPFKNDKDLFSAPGSDRVRLAPREKAPSGASAQRWTFDYKRNEWKWAALKLRDLDLAGASKFDFAIRSDRDAPVIIQLKESSGEQFWASVPVGSDWKNVSLSLSEFQVDQNSKRDGSLDPGSITEILLADGGATEGRSGRRSIWIGDLFFR